MADDNDTGLEATLQQGEVLKKLVGAIQELVQRGGMSASWMFFRLFPALGDSYILLQGPLN